MSSNTQSKKAIHSLKPIWLILFTVAFVACLSTTAALAQVKSGFSLSASPSTLTVLAGQTGWSAPSDVTVQDLGGFSGRVSLAVSGLPAGVSSALTAVNSSTTGVSF